MRFTKHASLGARRVAKHMRANQGYNHFREWADLRRVKPYLLGYRRTRGSDITTIKAPV